MTQQAVDNTTLRYLVTLPSQRRIPSSSPWPWTNPVITGSDAGTSTEPPCPVGCIHTDCSRRWSTYPQSLFPNWTPFHVEKSGIAKALTSRPSQNGTELACVVRGIDLRAIIVSEPNDNRNPKIQVVFEKTKEHVVFEENKDNFYSEIQEARSNETRVRALFVENLSGPVLQMLGTKYRIDPLFFSSVLNWVPTRRRESPSGKKERITIVFPFLRVMQESDSKVNTRSQLRLSPDVALVQDLLAIHVVRNPSNSTIFSFHSSRNHLRHRIWDACQSNPWQNLLRGSVGPRLFPLLYFWYVLYGWDEALEVLYSHISMMELEAQEHGGVALIERLHLIRCHIFSYPSVLQELRESVSFIGNSALPNFSSNEGNRECESLLGEIDRLEKSIIEPSAKLENLIRLTESQRMQALMEATIRSNAAMGPTVDPTLVVLPLSFVSGVFLGICGSAAQYFGALILLTILTIWVVVTFKTKHGLNDSQLNHWNEFASSFLVFLRRFSMERQAPGDLKDGTPL